MVDPARLREMIALASFESGRGKEALKITSYYRSDYVGLQLIKSFFLTSLGFLIAAGLFVAGNAEALLDALVFVDFGALVPGAVFLFLAVQVVFGIIAAGFALARYRRALREKSDYELHLRDLSSLLMRDEDELIRRTPQ